MIVSTSSPKESMDLIDMKNRERWISAILRKSRNDYNREELEKLPLAAIEDIYINM